MAFISRLTLCVVSLLLAVSSFAAISPVQTFEINFGPSKYPLSGLNTAGCKAAVAAHYGSTYVYIDGTSYSPSPGAYGTCSGSWGTATPYLKSSGCPANSLMVAGNCVCQAEFEEQDGACVPQNGCPSAGTVEGNAGEMFELPGNYPPGNICSGGCSWASSGSTGCLNGKCYYVGPLTSLDKTCVPSSPGPGDGTTPPSGEAPPKTPPDEKQCVEKGLCPFYLNGNKFCTKCDTKEGTSSESGSSNTENKDAQGNPTGNTGTTNTAKQVTVTCTGDRCSTQTVKETTNPDGTASKETTTGEVDKQSFCKANPGHIVCKGEDEGTWGGSCSGGFQCTGDAVQCAQAQAAWKAACLFDVDASNAHVVKGGQAMSADQSALRAQLGLDDSGDEFSLSSLINTDPLFAAGGGCPADQQVHLLGQTLTLSLSPWCSWLQTAGTVLQAAAFLAAGLIVFRRG